MLDQTLVQSGFDAEILLGERELTYILLTLIDAGRIPTKIVVGGETLELGLPREIDRTYDLDPNLPPFQTALDSLHPLEVEILFGQAADLRVHAVVFFQGAPVEGDLFVTLTFGTERDLEGMLAKATIGITLVDIGIDPQLLSFLESQHGITKEDIVTAVKAQVDRDVDLGSVSAFKRVQEIAFQKVDADGDHPRALGLYVNMRLQVGPEPESLMEARGDLADARNFLPAGSDCAMVSRPGLYGDLAADAFHRFAEIDENGNVSHPWHKSPFNKKSKVIGSIVDVDVMPLLPTTPSPVGPNTPTPPTLKIDVEVEYQIDNFIDPNAHLVLLITPTTNSKGVMRWSINADFHASLALEILGFLILAGLVAASGGLLGLSFGAAIAAGMLGGPILDFLGHALVDELYSGRVEKKADARIPDVISGRVEVAQRRWDPFYLTHHHIGMRLDGSVINPQGVALWGKACIDREIELIDHVVIRDKKAQSPSPPTHLRYRVFDGEDFLEDFEENAPGTDRRTFERLEPDSELPLYQLSIEEVTDRLAERRILPDLAYIAKRVDMRQHQVHSILVISQRETNETRNALIGVFTDARIVEIDAADGAQIRIDVQAEFDAAGITPTQEEFDARVAEVLEERAAPLVDAYIEGPLVGDLEAALLPLLRFDLPPENFGALEKKKILHLLELKLVTMHDGFMHYRDDPDFFTPDNLHSRPRYTETPDGPVFP